MVPIGLMNTLKIMDNDFMVYQYYLKNHKSIRIVGFGRNKEEAVLDFKYELRLEKENKTVKYFIIIDTVIEWIISWFGLKYPISDVVACDTGNESHKENE